MKSLKTPLRYPGGKSRAISKLFQFMPDMKTISTYKEPFLGGGSMAIAMTQYYPHLQIVVSDLYEPLVNFWIQLQQNGNTLCELLKQYKLDNATPDQAKQLFIHCKEDVNDREKSDISRAAAFYVVNKCSFSGLTESSSFSQQASTSNFSMRGIEKLKDYSELISGWEIYNVSYDKMMDLDSHTFMYLDPPYEIKDNLYGKKGSMHKAFDHDEFAEKCNLNKNTPMLVSYNSSNLIKDRFTGWYSAEFAHTYTMRSVGSYTTDQALRHELVLTNYEI